jgi:hypothetical protein
MAQHYSEICARYLRLAVILCLGGAASCLAQTCRAASPSDIYQATVPIADRSEAAQTAAFQAALKIVLVRATGRRSADEDPALAPLVTNARRYVQQYRAAADKQQWVAFDGPAIERWLAQNGQPVWGHERPSTFVWLTVTTGPQSGTVVTSADVSEMKRVIDAAAAARGIELVWPSAADLQKNQLDYASLNTTSPTTLGEIGRRSGGDGMLIGRASGAGPAASVHWTFLFQDHSSDVSGVPEGVNHAADTYAGLFSASGGIVPVDVEVTGIGDLRDYAYVEAYLESLTFISHVGVLSLSGDSARFHLTMRGGAESLQRALALHGRFQPIAAGDNGIQRFQLRR